MNSTYAIITTWDNNKVIQRTDEDGTITYIPIDPANSDYQAYLKSLENEAPSL